MLVTACLLQTGAGDFKEVKVRDSFTPFLIQIHASKVDAFASVLSAVSGELVDSTGYESRDHTTHLLIALNDTKLFEHFVRKELKFKR